MTQGVSSIELIESKLELAYYSNGGLSKSIKFSGPEFNVLNELRNCSGDTLSNKQLINVGWNGRPTGDNSLAVVISNLRKKLESTVGWRIVNIPKVGYWLDESESLIVGEPGSDECQKVSYRVSTGKTLSLCILLCLNFFIVVYIVSNWARVTCVAERSNTLCTLKGEPLEASLSKVEMDRNVFTKFTVGNDMVFLK